jgi:hypothetical protein
MREADAAMVTKPLGRGDIEDGFRAGHNAVADAVQRNRVCDNFIHLML